MKADPKKVTAIQEIQQPNDKKELQRFVWVVNYLVKFIPNLSSVTVSLRELLKKETTWHWRNYTRKRFQKSSEESRKKRYSSNIRCVQTSNIVSRRLFVIRVGRMSPSRRTTSFLRLHFPWPTPKRTMSRSKRNSYQNYLVASNITNTSTQSQLPWKQTTSL